MVSSVKEPSKFDENDGIPSKIRRNGLKFVVIQMATYFKVDEKEMLTLWVADKILSDLEGEEDLKLTAIETAKDELLDVNR